jgi:hypothetical protein
MKLPIRIKWPLQRGKNGEQGVSLRTHIFWSFAIPFVLLFAVVMWVAESLAHEAALRGASENFRILSVQTSEALQRLEEPARGWLDGMSGNTAQGLDDGGTFDLLRPHFDLLARHAHIAAVYFGYNNGDFARVLALRDANLRNLLRAPDLTAFAVQTILHKPEARVVETWRFYNAAQALLKTEERPHNGYDPRQRPWYAAALALRVGEKAATAPYLFAEPRLLGVTLAAPLAGNRAGLGGVDFTLTDLTAYLARQNAGGTKTTVVFDKAQRVWASSDRASVDAELARGQLPRMSDLAAPALRAIGPGMATPLGAPGAELDSDSGRWVVDVTALQGTVVDGLFVMVAQPYDDVFSDASRLRWTLAGLLLLGLIGGVVLIRLLATRLAAPLRAVATQVKMLERFKFREIRQTPSNIRELRSLQNTVGIAQVALAGYARYVPRAMVQHFLAIRREPKAGVETREVVLMRAVLGVPLHRFGVTNDEAFGQLDIVTRCVQSTHGLVDHYDNRGMNAVWNAPLVQQGAALRACEAAYQAVQQALRSHARGGLRIGIDMGGAGVGNLGGQARLIYTVVGMVEEAAAALAQHMQAPHSGVMVSEAVAVQIAHRFELGPIVRMSFDDGEPLAGFLLIGRKAGVDAADFGPRGPDSVPPDSLPP